jgi:GTP diphosphokinase / guanosine-3',5'-bis(diphosphate) 3'-diphosphatase
MTDSPDSAPPLHTAATAAAVLPAVATPDEAAAVPAVADSQSGIDALALRAAAYLTPEQVALLREAFTLADAAHAGQVRKSGEPYIEHPLAVASILVDMHMDHETLMAAVLHDVIEDTSIDKQEIGTRFGSEVAHIVDGLSKLTQIEFESYAEAQARNIQKMLLAMASDIRVILVKLADRLHNMRTLGVLASAKRRRIARETLDIYAPIAQRLGMNIIRLELEELGFATLYPMRHRVLLAEVRRIRGHRKEIVGEIRTAIKRRLRQERFGGQVVGREKHLHSIYTKMRQKGLRFQDVNDVYAFRILVDTVDSCYRVLGIVHNLFKPMPGKFKDYIAIPKSNGYQSLHTVLFGPYGVPIEVQIRTHQMDDVAEQGIAAHWLYKSGDGLATTAQNRAREWLKGVLEMQRQAGNSEEFLEHVKTDLFPQEVYVFTPKGDIRELPAGATAVDLAYAIHTELGNTCVAARVDRRLSPLRTPLKTGQTVEIITAPGARPNPQWLNFVTTAKARSHIRHYLKNLQRGEALGLGQRLLGRELELLGLDLAALDSRELQRLAEELRLADFDSVLEEIGLGRRLAALVARSLHQRFGSGSTPAPAVPTHAETRPLVIRGTEGMVLSFPKCCYPVPGDAIVGRFSAGRGLVVHRQSCRNVIESREAPDEWVDLSWASSVSGDFAAEIRMEVTNQRGALATIAAALSQAEANIQSVEMRERDDRYVSIGFVIDVRDVEHLDRVLRAAAGIRHVVKVTRAG